jgi:hypothetical protein
MGLNIKLALAAAGMTLAAQTAMAAPITYYSTLSGMQEAPSVASPGTGYGSVTLDGDMLMVSLSFSGLSAPTIFSHIHCCVGAGMNGPVALDFGASFPVGVTAGSFSTIFNLADLSTYSTGFRTANGGTLASVQAAFVNGFLGGRSYFNVHTSAFRSGEIRGQIPEPAALSLLGLGLIGLGLRRRQH